MLCTTTSYGYVSALGSEPGRCACDASRGLNLFSLSMIVAERTMSGAVFSRMSVRTSFCSSSRSSSSRRCCSSRSPRPVSAHFSSVISRTRQSALSDSLSLAYRACLRRSCSSSSSSAVISAPWGRVPSPIPPSASASGAVTETRPCTTDSPDRLMGNFNQSTTFMLNRPSIFNMSVCLPVVRFWIRPNIIDWWKSTG